MNNAYNNGIPDCAIEKAYFSYLKDSNPDTHTQK